MCGIAGELRFDRSVSDLSITRAMCDVQIHRGPDDEGYYASGPISLGIRRLAIVDLNKGSYPLRNEEDTVRLLFDGRIYNFWALRAELERLGHNFRSNEDAETLVHGYEEWGLGLLRELNGMFAFALWDETRRILWLARDHIGIKPLYYHKNDKFLVFASEIKPLLGHPEISVRPNERVIRQYLQNGMVDVTEDTFFSGISRLPPANYVLAHSDGVVERQRYWKPNISRSISEKTSGRTIETTRLLFIDAIRQQLVAGVPTGVSLSSGIDSSSIISVMKNIHSEGAISYGHRIKAFSAAFPGDPIDETSFMKDIWEATGPEKFVVTLTWEDFWRDLPSLVRCQEEPFAASFVYSEWRVIKCARERGVKVVFEGHGGDELLCGYPEYYFYYFMTLVKQRKWRRLLTEALLSFDLARDAAKTTTAYISLHTILTHLGSVIDEVLLRRAALVHQSSTDKSSWLSETPTTDLAAKLEIDAVALKLPPALRYMDKNSMWHSIEVRLPFLHKTFFDHFASLPLDQKIRNGWTKYAFRLAMKNLLPSQIRLRRTKIGFQTPVDKWIENELRGKVLDFFSGPGLKATRYYHAHGIRSILGKRKLTGCESRLIWRVLNLEMWYREFFSETSDEDV